MERLNKILFACGFMLVFLTGFLASYATNSLYIDKESPFLIGFASQKAEPGNWINENSIQVLNDRVCVYAENARISSYEATGSMLPVLGENANGIEIAPENPEQISVGDIITYQKDDKLIVHRVVEKGKDKNGNWFVTKGDNNSEVDGKVYFKDIKYITIGLVY